ncbi:MAG: hypothetical protein ACYDD1_13430, partial [Caulobacteraceae bacterium]
PPRVVDGCSLFYSEFAKPLGRGASTQAVRKLFRNAGGLARPSRRFFDAGDQCSAFKARICAFDGVLFIDDAYTLSPQGTRRRPWGLEQRPSIASSTSWRITETSSP